jgi:pimeloyl-ACP methyl ester carboxylesterase
MDQAFTDELGLHYGDNTIPVNIIWGEADTWLPIAQGRRLAEMIPEARFNFIPDTAHLVQADVPKPFKLRRIAI